METGEKNARSVMKGIKEEKKKKNGVRYTMRCKKNGVRCTIRSENERENGRGKRNREASQGGLKKDNK